jgi:hypothetical protein
VANCEAIGLEHGAIKQRREHLCLQISGIDRATDQRGCRSTALRKPVVGDAPQSGDEFKTAIIFGQTKGWVAQNVARDVKK